MMTIKKPVIQPGLLHHGPHSHVEIVFKRSILIIKKNKIGDEALIQINL